MIMGEIRELLCKCGYKKQIFLGAGIQGYNRMAIARYFSKEAVEFKELYEAGKVKSFILKNVTVSCKQCRKIESVACFVYKTEFQDKKYIKDSCTDCGNKMEEILRRAERLCTA